MLHETPPRKETEKKNNVQTCTTRRTRTKKMNKNNSGPAEMSPSQCSLIVVGLGSASAPEAAKYPFIWARVGRGCWWCRQGRPPDRGTGLSSSATVGLHSEKHAKGKSEMGCTKTEKMLMMVLRNLAPYWLMFICDANWFTIMYQTHPANSRKVLVNAKSIKTAHSFTVCNVSLRSVKSQSQRYFKW